MNFMFAHSEIFLKYPHPPPSAVRVTKKKLSKDKYVYTYYIKQVLQKLRIQKLIKNG